MSSEDSRILSSSCRNYVIDFFRNICIVWKMVLRTSSKVDLSINFKKMNVTQQDWKCRKGLVLTRKKMLVVCWDTNIYQLNLFFFKTKAIM